MLHVLKTGNTSVGYIFLYRKQSLYFVTNKPILNICITIHKPVGVTSSFSIPCSCRIDSLLKKKDLKEPLKSSSHITGRSEAQQCDILWPVSTRGTTNIAPPNPWTARPCSYRKAFASPPPPEPLSGSFPALPAGMMMRQKRGGGDNEGTDTCQEPPGCALLPAAGGRFVFFNTHTHHHCHPPTPSSSVGGVSGSGGTPVGACAGLLGMEPLHLGDPSAGKVKQFANHCSACLLPASSHQRPHVPAWQ